jgi:hypothetical protein
MTRQDSSNSSQWVKVNRNEAKTSRREIKPRGVQFRNQNIALAERLRW